MSPMSTAAMNSVAPEKAGVGSGILSMSRMVGWHLRGGGDRRPVPASGAQRARRQAGRHGCDGRRSREQLVHNLGAGSQGGESLPPAVVSASHDAFVHAFANGMWLSASVAAVGALRGLLADRAEDREAARPGPTAGGYGGGDFGELKRTRPRERASPGRASAGGSPRS